MITVQSTTSKTRTQRHRHPDILKYKIAYIRDNASLFHKLFSEKEEIRKGRMKGRLSSIWKGLWSPRALEEGEKLKKLFGYNDKTNVIDILFHFRRLYSKLYPNHLSL